MEHRVTVLLRQVDRPNQLDGCHEHESDLLLGRQFWGPSFTVPLILRCPIWVSSA
jgi:hypothetical protein